MRRWTILATILAIILATSAVACGPAAPRARPQVATESTGQRYPALPPSAKVKIYRRGEPDDSYREIGTVTSSCPVKHWVRGHEVKGRPICMDGLRQGARRLGGHAVVDIEVRRTRPDWEPDHPWWVMRGVVIRLVH